MQITPIRSAFNPDLEIAEQINDRAGYSANSPTDPGRLHQSEFRVHLAKFWPSSIFPCGKARFCMEQDAMGGGKYGWFGITFTGCCMTFKKLQDPNTPLSPPELMQTQTFHILQCYIQINPPGCLEINPTPAMPQHMKAFLRLLFAMQSSEQLQRTITAWSSFT